MKKNILYSRVLAVLLALCCLGFSPTAFALEYPHLTGDYDQLSRIVETDRRVEVYQDGQFVSDSTALTLRPGSVVEIYMPASLLSLTGLPLDNAALRQADIQPKYKAYAGSGLLERITVSTDYSDYWQLTLTFTANLAQTRELAFSYQVFLTEKGRKHATTEITIAGTIANNLCTADTGDTYIDLSDGTVVQATGYVRDIQVYLGHNVSIVSNFFENARYYGVATTEPDLQDALLLNHYPEIDMVYSLRTIGLKQGNRNTVIFDLPQSYHAFNAQGQYLGTTRKPLPYSTKYYLSTTLLESINFEIDD